MGGNEATDESQGPLYFWGHKAPPYDFLSQHFKSTFSAPPPTFPSPPLPLPTSIPASPENTLIFTSAEQYMMYAKALLFGDTETAAKILETQEPGKQKALGRLVSRFEEEVWEVEREGIVVMGTWWKFGREGNDGLRIRLLKTGERELVEASPFDRIWGIGFAKDKAELNRERWGLNLLGKALMKVRDRLKEEQKAANMKAKEESS